MTAEGRDKLRDALDYVREGDTFVITRLDRLARSISDLFVIMERLQGKGVGFRCLQQSGIDTESSAGRLMLTMLGAVAAFEADIRKERQIEGIAKAKRAGVYKGRKPTIDRDQVRRLYADGTSPTKIARQLGIARASVYRCLRVI